MAAAKHPVKTATTATGTAIRGTAKRIAEAGIDLSKPVIFRGYDLNLVDQYCTPTRYERVEVTLHGATGITAAGERFNFGGVATRFWLEQVAEAPAAVVTEVTADADSVMVGGKLLSEMTFPQVMKLAKVYRTPGRSTARLPELRAGVAAAILADSGALAAIVS